MDFAKFQSLVEARPGFETMDKPTASGEYFSDSCGDMYNFFLKVGPGAVIEDISYFTTGCGFGTATCSLVVELAKGKTIEEAGAITTAQVEAELRSAGFHRIEQADHETLNHLYFQNRADGLKLSPARIAMLATAWI